MCLPGQQALAADARPVVGEPIAKLIESYRERGLPFLYSSDLLPESITIERAPSASDPIGITREVLAPHGLALLEADGLLLIVRDNDPDDENGSILVIIRQPGLTESPEQISITSTEVLPEPRILAPGVYKYDDLEPGQYDLTISIDGYVAQTEALQVNTENIAAVSVSPVSMGAAFETIIVTTSRYELTRQLASSVFYITNGSINRIPDLGDDPIRAAQRLPGVAAGGLSAKSHFRGGERDENAIVLNGHRLLDPFHIRNYQSVFSAVDPRTINEMEIYTGGFPVRYGTRMSGLTVIDTLKPENELYTELGLSVYNTSLLSTGSFDTERGNWLISARRGNLDLVLPSEYGDPRYGDLFAQVGYEVSPGFDISFNAFLLKDRVLVITESDSDDQKQLDDKSDNAQYWVTLDNEWTPSLTSSTVLSVDSFTNERVGFIADIEKIVGNVDDQRDIDIYGVLQDWTWLVSDDYLVQWGIDLSHSEASYTYMSNVQYSGFFAAFVGVPDSISRNLMASPDGDNYSFYVSNRKQFSNKLIAELGMRWDKQTYTDMDYGIDFSPRLNLFYPVGDNTELRLSWGRFYQPQNINELQIEDGVTTFFTPQSSDQIVLGLQQRIGDHYLLRTELFYKDMSSLKPRYENLFDPLALIPEIEPDRTRIAPTSALAKGVEVLVEYNGFGSWDWWASYTWSSVEDKVNGAEVPRSWDQTSSIMGGFSWTSGPWEADFAAKLHSGWPTTGVILNDLPGGGYTVMPAERNALRYNDFFTVDIRVSRKFEVGSGLLTGFLELSNTTNRENYCCTDYDADDSSGTAVLETTFRDWLPLLPAIGVLYQF